MKTLIFLLCFLALSDASLAGSCSKIGNTTFGSDGTTYNRIGNTTYGSDGTTSNRIGNTQFINGPNGTTTCNKIGNTTYCN